MCDLEGSLAALGRILGVLGPLLGALGPLLGVPGPPVGCSWRVAGALCALLKNIDFHMCFCMFCGHWQVSGRAPGASWGALGWFWGFLEALGMVLGASWGPLGVSWGDLGGSWGALGSFLGALGASWCDLGRSGLGTVGFIRVWDPPRWERMWGEPCSGNGFGRQGGGTTGGGNSNQRPATEDQNSELDGLMIRELELRN